MYSNFFLQFLSFSGVLNVKIGNKTLDLEYSRVHAVFNGIKICALVSLKSKFLQLFEDHAASSFSEMLYSPFAIDVIGLYFDVMVYQSALIIMLQLIKGQRNVTLISEIIRCRKVFLDGFPPAAAVFEEFDRKLRRDIAVILSASLAWLTMDFSTSMQRTFPALLAYLIFMIPFYVNFSLLFHCYTIMRFIVHGQKVLILCAAEIAKQTSLDDLKFKVAIDNISSLRSTLYSTKQCFVSTICLAMALMLLGYIRDIVIQVTNVMNYFALTFR